MRQELDGRRNTPRIRRATTPGWNSPDSKTPPSARGAMRSSIPPGEGLSVKRGPRGFDQGAELPLGLGVKASSELGETVVQSVQFRQQLAFGARQ